MTTTAHEDQFTVAPEPVHQPYSTADILRRNVADLEIALKQQTERAEAAEAELLAVREDNHSMMMEIDELRKELAKLRKQKPVAWINLNKWTPSNGPRCVTHEEYEKERELLTKLTAVYAAPVPAPAVPEDWREAMQEAHDTFQRYADLHQAKGTHDGYEKAKANQKLANKLYAMLQSAEVTK
jgi:hypothetical protein